MGLRINDPKTFSAMAAEMREMAEVQSNPDHAARFRKVATQYDKRRVIRERALERRRKTNRRDGDVWTRPNSRKT